MTTSKKAKADGGQGGSRGQGGQGGHGGHGGDEGKAGKEGKEGKGGDLAVLAQKMEELEGELIAARDEADRLKDLAARAQADLQNAKIRMEKQESESRAYAVAGLLERLIPTIDNFQRAFDHLPEELKDHDWVKGLQATEQALMSDLQAVGLKKIDCLGKPADPSHCEILQVAPGEKDTVVQILEDGYELHDKILRPAKVVVGGGDEKKK